jgi:DNA mismatch repair ATPase MutS
MSGKSTFLRAIGLNTALAWAGGPVCATSMRISPLHLGVSIRVTDSVLDNRSRFFAEIVRIKQIVDLAKEFRAALFLLDELLSGTNSHDRQIGAAAIVRKLVELGAVGIITTHDLALAHIADQLNGRAKNAHFDDQIVNGEITFDYRLRPGVVTHSNALELMRSVGLDVSL